jgi:hypothetical protein
MTPELEQFLRKQNRVSTPVDSVDNVPQWTAKTVYRLYTEDVGGTRYLTKDLVRAFFPGATLTYGIGMDARTQENDEENVTIEIVTSAPDAEQRIIELARALRIALHQISVLVTRSPIVTHEVTR